MLAGRLPSVLSPPSITEALAVTRVHSVAGLLRPGQALITRRPFLAPHDTISDEIHQYVGVYLLSYSCIKSE
jgi:magnesium chelatase family protein